MLERVNGTVRMGNNRGRTVVSVRQENFRTLISRWKDMRMSGNGL